MTTDYITEEEESNERANESQRVNNNGDEGDCSSNEHNDDYNNVENDCLSENGERFGASGGAIVVNKTSSESELLSALHLKLALVQVEKEKVV